MTTLNETQTPEARLEAPATQGASGTRSGALLAAASVVSIFANYVFLLAAGRILGSDRYGSLAALLGLLAVVIMPAGAVQLAVSREISRLLAAGKSDEADSFARATMRLALLLTAPLVAVAVALAAPLAHLLHIHSVGVVALAEFAFVTALVFPAAMGVLQGRQRFHALAALYIVPVVARLVLLAVVASAGYRLGGAVFATVVGSIAAAGVAVVLIAEPLQRGGRVRRPNLRPFLRYLAPVGVGMIGIALLTHIDILIVKSRFSADDAGAYAAASAFARVGFFLPATILAVLFPRTAARHARGEETEDILGRSLLATAAFCAALAVFYAATGPGLVTATFGRDFAEGGRILAPFAIAIGLFSLAQIYVGYHLSRGETRYAWIVAASVLAQVAVLGTVPSTLHQVVWANVIIGAGLVAAHEVFAGSSVPALRAGLRHLSGVAAGVRAFLPEATLVLLGTTAFTCALFWPVVRHLNSTILGTIGQDSTGSVATLWSQGRESGYHVLGVTHHTVSGAPFGWNETNAINLQLALVYYPTYLLGKVIGYIAAYNVITLAGYALSGAAMYALTRYLGCSRLVASWAALVFIVFPYHLAHDQHASLLHLEVFPVLFIALIAAARHPTWSRFSLVGLATLACWLTSGYFGPMAMVTVAAFSIGAALLMRRRQGIILFVGCTVFALVATGIMGLGAVASNTNSGVGTGRVVGDLSIFGIRPADLLVPPVGNLVLGNRLLSFWDTRVHGSNYTEIANYLGVGTLLLAAAWLVYVLRRRKTIDRTVRIATAGLVASLVAGLLFAAPSPLFVFGHKVWAPSRVLFELVPAFRVLSRWDFLLMAALAPLAALGLEVARRTLVRRRVGSVLSVAVVAAMAAFSFAELTIHPWNTHFRTVPVPPEYDALADTPSGILADYPLGYSDIYRLWQIDHGRRLVNGAPPGTLADEARLVLLDPTQPGTAQELALLGVTVVGVHPHSVADAEVRPGDLAHAKGYRLVGRFPDGASIWDVVAPAAPAFVTLPAGFATPVRNGSFVGYPFVAGNGVGALDLRARQAQILRLVFEVRPPAHVQGEVRLADASGEHAFKVARPTTISALVAVPRGASRILIKVDPAPTSAANEMLMSAPYTQAATGEAVLHAMPLSSDPGF
jgi:O-antigen/teichoic acid export membrane protein